MSTTESIAWDAYVEKAETYARDREADRYCDNCGAVRTRHTAWVEAEVGGLCCAMLCSDCIDEYGDELRQCADCGQYWHNGFAPDFFGGGLCDACQERRGETQEEAS